MLTNNQVAHRQFISSPLWHQIRARAIETHGPNCNSCGGTGSDVHHKTYERFGGNELMSDLEVLCRDCHEAKHAASRHAGKRRNAKKRPWIRALAAYRYLTRTQKDLIKAEFKIESDVELFNAFPRHKGMMLTARRLLSVNIIECRKHIFDKINNRQHGRGF